MTRRTQLFTRALLLRCPHCGGRGLFRHWLAMKESCPVCGLSLTTGNRVGAYIFNIAGAEILMTIVVVAIVVRTWPAPPWSILQYLAPAMMLLTPLVFYPFSKLLWVAMDLAMHPNAEPDARVHGEVRSKK
jgi:uncharacterized protein (DUF983 family)